MATELSCLNAHNYLNPCWNADIYTCNPLGTWWETLTSVCISLWHLQRLHPSCSCGTSLIFWIKLSCNTFTSSSQISSSRDLTWEMQNKPWKQWDESVLSPFPAIYANCNETFSNQRGAKPGEKVLPSILASWDIASGWNRLETSLTRNTTYRTTAIMSYILNIAITFN